MLHLYFLSVGPVLDPVVTGCCYPPVAVVLGSVAGVRGSGAAPLWILWRQDDLSPPAAPAVSVASYSRRLQYLLLLRWLLFDRLRWLVLLQWLSGCRSSGSSAVDPPVAVVPGALVSRSQLRYLAVVRSSDICCSQL